MAVSSTIGTGKKNYTNWRLGLSRRPGNKFDRQFERQ